MSVTNNTYNINTLQSNTTFYDWYVKENTEIIAKLNLLKVYGATSGDGVLATTNTNGILTLNIGGTSGNISTGLTFNGNIDFNGLVNLPSISYKIEGITTGTSGFSFGMPIRVVSNGYTAARANTQSTAESIGILSNLGTNNSYLTLLGKVTGDFTSVNSGATLNAGCFYFLSESITGGITPNEPTTSGYVSKPVLLGLSADCGLVLPYRGNYLSAGAGISGATGMNRVYVVLPTATTTTWPVGSALSYNPSLTTYFNENTPNGRTIVQGWFLSKSTNTGELIGEEDFVVGLIASKTTSGSDTIFEIATSGDLDIDIGSGVGVYYLSNNYNALLDSTNLVIDNSTNGTGYLGKLFGMQYNTNKFTIINNPRKTQNFGLLASVSTGASGNNQTENLLLNGDFVIWQRPNTGRDSSNTTTGDLLFADMWRRHDGVTGATGSKSYYVTREKFDDVQSDVEGNPKYFINVKALGASGGTGAVGGYGTDHLLIGHVIPDAKSFDSQKITLSFYAKCSHSNYEVTSYISRYNGVSRIDYETIQNHSLTTGWQKFVVQYDVPTLPNPGSPLENDYFEIGLNFKPLINKANLDSVSISTNVFVSLASVCLYSGAVDSPTHIHGNTTHRLKSCRKYYYSTYSLDQIQGLSTMTNKEDPSYNTPSHILIPNGLCQFVPWENELRTNPTITIYSPLNGTSNDAYNRTSGRNLKNSSGTIGYNSTPRVAKLGVDTVITDASKDGIKVCISGGAVNYDNVFYHIIADADYPI